MSAANRIHRARQAEGERDRQREREECLGKAVSPKFGVMDWSPRYPLLL